ncbi:hypothetical protein ABZW03_04530 [Kitasatospora sp. NPDC004799]|uniref:hypothetical protein n=1 Tax=Kitasatospora sp. NPDC004799 TaxID=3154460 RepID=UPI0033A65BB9
MPSNDAESYLDHTHLTAADFTAFEHLLAAQRDRRPFTDSDWRLVLSSSAHGGDGRWESTYALFRPDGAFSNPSPDDETYVRVYFDKNGRALPDRPHAPGPLPPFAAELAEHLPGWTVQASPLAPGRDLAELRSQAWGWGRLPWNTASAPHTALTLTGPDGERLLAVRTDEDAPLLLGAAKPDDLPDYDPQAVHPPALVVLPADVPPATVATEVTTALGPRCRQAAWLARTSAATHAINAIRRLGTAYIPAPGDLWGRGEIGSFDSLEARNRAAWPYAETLVSQGPYLVADIRSAATIEDHLNPAIGLDLRRLHVSETALNRLREVRDSWWDATAGTTGFHPEADQIRQHAEDLRNAEAWTESSRIADGPITALATHVTRRIGLPAPDREEQVKAAVARSGHLPGQSAPVPVPAPTPLRPDARHPAR